MLDTAAIYKHITSRNGELVTLDDVLDWFPPATSLTKDAETQSILAKNIPGVNKRIESILFLPHNYFSPVSLIVLINKDTDPESDLTYDKLVSVTYNQLIEVDGMIDASKYPMRENGKTISNKPFWKRLIDMWRLPHLCCLSEAYVGKFGPQYRHGFVVSASQTNAKDIVKQSLEMMGSDYSGKAKVSYQNHHS